MTQNKLIEAELKRALVAALEWIDAVPSDLPLPAMPGFDRDWVDSLLALSTAQAQEPAACKVFYDDSGKERARIEAANLYEIALAYDRGWAEASPPAPSTPDAREIVEQCAKVADEYAFQARSVAANNNPYDAISLAGYIANAIRALPLPTPSAPDAALREAVDALEPFAKAEKDYGENRADNCWIWQASQKNNITLGDLRRAAKVFAALSNSGQMEKGA